MSAFRVTIPPASEPISVTEAEAHARIDVTDSGTPSRLTAAREMAEQHTWRALVLQTIEERYDGFPRLIKLQRSPVREVSSIQYVDTAGDLQTLDTTEYQVHTADEPCRILPAYSKNWPSTRAEPDSVRVTYLAGHTVPFTADAGTDVVTAADHWFADGDAVPIWNTGGALPAGLSQGTYFARDVSGDTFKLAATSGGAAVDITDTGSGTHFAGALPYTIRAAMLLTVAELDAHREDVALGTIATELPRSAAMLLQSERVWGY